MTFHIALDNPKFPHNVGAALRAASAWGAESLWFSGERVSLEPKNGQRLPREERMKGYQDVALYDASMQEGGKDETLPMETS